MARAIGFTPRTPPITPSRSRCALQSDLGDLNLPRPNMSDLSRSTLARITVPALLLACAPLLLGAAQSGVSRTPDGHPDLSGMWTNYDTTPFERLRPGEEFPRDLAVSTADWLVQDSPRSPR